LFALFGVDELNGDITTVVRPAICGANVI